MENDPLFRLTGIKLCVDTKGNLAGMGLYAGNFDPVTKKMISVIALSDIGTTNLGCKKMNLAFDTFIK